MSAKETDALLPTGQAEKPNPRQEVQAFSGRALIEDHLYFTLGGLTALYVVCFSCIAIVNNYAVMGGPKWGHVRQWVMILLCIGGSAVATGVLYWIYWLKEQRASMEPMKGETQSLPLTDTVASNSATVVDVSPDETSGVAPVIPQNGDYVENSVVLSQGHLDTGVSAQADHDSYYACVSALHILTARHIDIRQHLHFSRRYSTPLGFSHWALQVPKKTESGGKVRIYQIDTMKTIVIFNVVFLHAFMCRNGEFNNRKFMSAYNFAVEPVIMPVMAWSSGFVYTPVATSARTRVSPRQFVDCYRLPARAARVFYGICWATENIFSENRYLLLAPTN
eukprot:515434-Pyramimonas_sp.AAC.1